MSLPETALIGQRYREEQAAMRRARPAPQEVPPASQEAPREPKAEQARETSGTDVTDSVETKNYSALRNEIEALRKSLDDAEQKLRKLQLSDA